MKPSYIKEEKKLYIKTFSIGCVHNFLHEFNKIARLFPNSIRIPSFRVLSFGRKS